jgi:hypothetical protein
MITLGRELIDSSSHESYRLNASNVLTISAQSAIHDVTQKAQKISDSMDEVHIKADMIQSNVQNVLRPRLEQLSSDFQVNHVINQSKLLNASSVDDYSF